MPRRTNNHDRDTARLARQLLREARACGRNHEGARGFVCGGGPGCWRLPITAFPGRQLPWGLWWHAQCSRVGVYDGEEVFEGGACLVLEATGTSGKTTAVVRVPAAHTKGDELVGDAVWRVQDGKALGAVRVGYQPTSRVLVVAERVKDAVALHAISGERALATVEPLGVMFSAEELAAEWSSCDGGGRDVDLCVIGVPFGGDDDGAFARAAAVQEKLQRLVGPKKSVVLACVQQCFDAECEAARGGLMPGEVLGWAEAAAYTGAGGGAGAGAGGGALGIDECVKAWEWVIRADGGVAANRAEMVRVGAIPPDFESLEGVDTSGAVRTGVGSDPWGMGGGGSGERTRVVMTAAPEHGGKPAAWNVLGFDQPCLADGPLERARLFLMQKCDVGVGMAGGRYGLAFWGGKFFRYRVRARRWEAMEQSDRDGAPVELFAEVQEWLGGFLRERVLQNGSKYEPVDTGSHAVGEVVKSLRGQCLVRGSSMPCWLPRQRDEKGRPVWVEDGRGAGGGVKVERHAATDYIVFANGVLWVRGLLEEGPVELLPHDPMLFTQAVRPYELDVGALAEALTDGCSDALMQRLCPAFWQFLGDICESPTKEESEAKRANLQRMFGDALGADRSIEKICLVPGPRRAGKGTLFAALMSVVGREAVAVTSFYALGGDRFGLAPLVGASVAVLPDAHVAGLSDGTLAVEVLKTISGNDPVSVRDLYSPAQPNVQMGVRFWIFCNDPPEKLLDNSGALASRFVVWPMVRSFESVQDPRVKQRVATEGAGIAVWALVGWRDLWSMQVPMLASSEDGEAIRQEMMYMSSPLTRYVDDRLSTGPGLSVELGELHEDYVRWCEANGHDHPVGRNKLSTRLMTLVHGMRVVRRPKPENKSQKMTVLCGLHIRPDAEHIPGPVIPVSSDPKDDLQSWLHGRG